MHQPERLDPLVVGEAADYVAPEHLLQNVECSLDLGDAEARLEAVRRDLPGRRDDRLGPAFVHALDDQLEQTPHIATVLLRADCVVVCPMASLERGSSFLDYSILVTGQNC